MAKLKEYDRTVKIPGLPDTTNISDPQLRLFLDRIKMFCSELAISVDGLNNLNNIDAIATALMNNQNFNSMLNKTITQTTKPIIDKSININNKGRDIPLQSIDVTPDPITINLFTGGSGRVYENYIPGNTSAKYKGVVWSSSDSDIAIVDQSGNVTGIAVGECDVFATSTFNASISGSSKVTVINAETITVNANYRWCADGESSSVYTENQEPGASDLIWESITNTVTLYTDKTEYEAKEDAALSVIASTESRDYIVADGSSTRYWRDEENDYIYDYIAKNVYKAAPAGMNYSQASEYPAGIWVTSKRDVEGSAADTGDIYSAAFTGDSPTAEDIIAYNADKLKISEPIAWQAASDAGLYWNLNSATNEDGSTIEGAYGYLVPTGDSVTLTLPDGYGWLDLGLPEDFNGKFCEYKLYDGSLTAWATEEYLQGSGTFAALPSKPYIGELDGLYPAICPAAHNVNGGHLRDLAQVYGYVFKYDGLWRSTLSHGSIGGNVFDANSYPAWTTSPCAGDETIYTEAESPAIGDNYGTVTDGTFSASGTVSATGNAVYSIIGENGITYYRHE